MLGGSNAGRAKPTYACTEVIRAKHHTIVVKTHYGSEAAHFFTHRLERVSKGCKGLAHH